MGLDQWIGELSAQDGQAALREVTRRFVRAYGPTTQVELARWLYTPPAAARALLSSLGDELEEVEVDGWRAFTLRGSSPPSAAGRTVHLLPRFDCYIVGCHPRRQLIPAAAPAPLQRGTAAPFQVLLVDGAVAGLWSSSGAVTSSPSVSLRSARCQLPNTRNSSNRRSVWPTSTASNQHSSLATSSPAGICKGARVRAQPHDCGGGAGGQQ